MGFEDRKGRLYYYAKRREGGRVVSEYRGGGDLALYAGVLAEEEAERKAAERDQRRRERAEGERLDAEVDRLLRLVEALSASELVAAGYHNHKGQWRKRRDERTDEEG